MQNPQEKTKKLTNPLTRDFTVQYDYHHDGNPVSFTIHALETESFPAEVADHIKNHLCYEIAMLTKGRGTYEAAYQEALKKVEA